MCSVLNPMKTERVSSGIAVKKEWKWLTCNLRLQHTQFTMKFSITHILDGVFLHLCSGGIEGLKRLLETFLPCFIFNSVQTKVSHAVGESVYSSHTTTSIYNQHLVSSGRISLSHLIGRGSWGSCICTLLRELAVGLMKRIQLVFCFLLFFFSHSDERKHFTKIFTTTQTSTCK